MARCIAGFQPEARKYGRILRQRAVWRVQGTPVLPPRKARTQKMQNNPMQSRNLDVYGSMIPPPTDR
jgi:hypothetical protein